MSAEATTKTRWGYGLLAAAAGICLLFAGIQALSQGESSAAPRKVSTAYASAAATAYANRDRIFGLVRPAAGADAVLFAPARRSQPGGPETVRAVDAGPYIRVSLAPGVRIWVTAPIADDDLADYIKGVRVSPARFGELYRATERRYGPMMARAHMFELWFDKQGRATTMRHYFIP